MSSITFHYPSNLHTEISVVVYTDKTKEQNSTRIHNIHFNDLPCIQLNNCYQLLEVLISHSIVTIKLVLLEKCLRTIEIFKGYKLQYIFF